MITQTSERTSGVQRFVPAPPASAPAFVVPQFWTSTWNAVLRWVTGPTAPPPPDAARDSLILDAALALRGGRADDASALLAPHGVSLAHDAAYLNLLGAACELRRQWTLARRFYGVAMSVDPAYAPAQQNLRRLYELHTFGRCVDPLALGDVELRATRTVSPSHDHE